jgi:Tol biopolymer transport system component
MSTSCLSKFKSCEDQPKKQLTQFGTSGDPEQPSWNPTGREIGFVFIDGATGQRDIYISDLDGKIVNLTQTPNSDEDSFSFSPDGTHVVYKKDKSDQGTDLYIMDLASRTAIPITNSPHISEGKPYWSPDNNSIAYLDDVDSLNASLQIFSISNKALLKVNGADKEFLFWLTLFPEIQPGAVLQVSPSGNVVNLRQGPSTTDTSLAKLQAGDILKLIDTVTNGQNEIWWNVDSHNISGWVRQIYNWYLPVGNHPFSP